MRQIFALLAFSIGVFAPSFFFEILSFGFLCIILVLLCTFGYYFRHFWLISFAIGLAYGSFSAAQFSESILPLELNNQKVLMAGRIQGIPIQNGRIWRLDFIPENIAPLHNPDLSNDLRNYVPKKVRLSYYGYLDQPFVSGEQLYIEAKVQRPHGLMNTGLFDYQRWLVGEGYSATGYIKRLIERSEPQSGLSTIDRWRADLSRSIEQSDISNPGIQSALLMGERSGISSEHMSLFVQTGTVHLMVISGLHIGFIAAIGFFVARWLISFLVVISGSLVSGINSVRYAYLCAVISALCYAAAAGFSTPTMRATVMLAAVLLPKFFYLKTNHWWGFCLALVIVALIDPRAPLQNGFWLSFAAVALIFISLGRGSEATAQRNPLRSLMHIQLVFLFGFSTMVLMVQGQLNLVSFFANMLAVPMTGLIIIPLEMLGLLIFQIKTEYGIFIWDMAGRVIDIEICYLDFLHRNFQWVLVRNPVPVYVSIISVIASLVFFGLKSVKHRFIAILCILPVFVPLNFYSSNDFLLEVRVFDVGQGLSILVRQQDYNLIYDTGPKFSENFDSGADILAPSLAQLRVKQIDDLIISHPDADHMGGYQGLKKEIAIDHIWIGRQSDSKIIDKALMCAKGKSWHRGDVRYEFLHPDTPDSESGAQNDNDRSCVLKISFGDQTILFPGDISASVENRLVSESFLDEGVSLLIAPHHGSKTSSGKNLLETINPEAVVFSAGYMNRFGHPHPIVVQRYKNIGSKMYSTQKDGMIRFKWQTLKSKPIVKTEYENRIFWWQK